MAKYINQDDTIEVLDRVCKACDHENCHRHKGREYCPVMAVIDGIKDLPIADVQPADRDSLHIVYVGRKAYYAEKTIMSSIEAMYTIRDAITHIEHAYGKHKELLSQISCCTESGDVTPEIDYYISKIKELANQID